MRVGVIFILLLAILAIGVIFALIYFFGYKRHINRSLDEDRPSLRPMPNPTGAIAVVFSVLFCVIVLVLLVEVKTSVEDGFNNLSSRLNSVSQNMGWYFSELEERERREASLLEDFDFSVGEVDKKNLTAEAIFTITPKAVREDTTVSVYLDGKEYPANRCAGNVFRATVVLDILRDDYGAISVVIVNGGESRTERTGYEVYGLLRKCLQLPVYAACSPDEMTNGKQYNVGLSGECTVTDASFTRAELIASVDGEVIWRRDVTEDLKKASDGCVPFSDQQTFGKNECNQYVVRFEVADENGFLWKQSIFVCDLSENAISEYADTIEIYKDGVLLTSLY